MAQLPLTLLETPVLRRRGRPPGSRNRSSLDLARYVEAQFGGMTPGQQSAAICLVTPKDLRQAKARAQQLGIVDHGLGDMHLAMVVKATVIARAIGCETKEAWLLLQKEREGLMPYVHAKQAPVERKTGAAPATVFMVPEGDGPGAPLLDLGDDDAIDFVEHSPGDAGQVSPPKSHDTP